MTAAETILAVARELVFRVGRSAGQRGWGFALALVVVLGIVRSSKWPLRMQRRARVIAVAVVAAAGVAYAWSLIWASDDSYISFRYADNLVRGYGLVFNPGERIEGYTDFLWTMVIAAFIGVGADPGHAAILLNLASFVLVLVILARFPRRLTGVPLVLGPAPVLCALNYTMASFATAGLETMFAALLVLVAVERVESRRPLAGGLAAIGAAMSHPDHAIFYAALACAIALDRSRRRELAIYLAPFLFVFVPYFLWRWSYYGDLMPNTYYAKSAGRAYFEQGAIYFLVTFLGGGLAVVGPLAAVGAYALCRTTTGRFALIALPLYVGYIAKIGGDFMLGRLFVPAFVIVYLLMDAGFRFLLAENRSALAATLVVPTAIGVLPNGILKHGELFHGIADERTFTPVTDFSTMKVDAGGYALGHAMFRALSGPGTKPKVGLFNIGMPGYYSRVPVFDLRGLTSRSVARLPVKERGRPGHEKLASPGHAIEGGVVLSQASFYPPPYEGVTAVNVDGFPFYLAHYAPPLVKRLRNGHAQLSAPERLESSFARFDGQTPETVACHLWFLREYYFSSNDDPTRRARIAHAAAAVDETLAPVESLLLRNEDLAALGFSLVRSLVPDAKAPEWTADGRAAEWTHEAVLPEQGLAIGADGPTINTFTPAGLDASTGTLTSPTFVLEGDVMTFQIAGGKDAQSLSVSLEVDGDVVRRATGCQTEWLGTRIWDIAPFRGKQARVVVTDASSDAWGHLVVGAFREWRAPASGVP